MISTFDEVMWWAREELERGSNNFFFSIIVGSSKKGKMTGKGWLIYYQFVFWVPSVVVVVGIFCGVLGGGVWDNMSACFFLFLTQKAIVWRKLQRGKIPRKKLGRAKHEHGENLKLFITLCILWLSKIWKSYLMSSSSMLLLR